MNQSFDLQPSTTQEWFAALREQLSIAVMGQEVVLEQMLLTLLCREHALLDGPVGTAKWGAVQTLAQSFGLKSQRLRCSTDLEIGDVTAGGTWGSVWESNLVLVDGFDRLPAKLQSLLQQAMAERSIPTVEGSRDITEPFVVYATRYRADDPPLPERIEPYDDRFMFQISIPYPSYHEEYQVAATKSSGSTAVTRQVRNAGDLEAWRSLVQQIEAAPSVVHYAVRLVRATRVHEGENPDFIYEWVQHGAGPRAAHFLVLAAKARATLYGRSQASHDDVAAVVPPVLRHRLITNRNARTNGIGPDRVIRRLLEDIPPRVVGDHLIPAAGDALTFHDWVEE